MLGFPQDKRTFSLVWICCVGLLFFTCHLPGELCGQSPGQRDGRKVDVAYTTGGVVASDSPPASLVGRDVMVDGGNAVDAAVATAFAMAVTWPEAGNIGGGGFMMIAPPKGDVVCVDYRETAPANAGKDTFLKQKNRRDSRMVGVPGTVRGLAMAHKQFGKLPWKDLVLPAVELARNGFVVDQPLADSVNAALNRQDVKSDSPLYTETKRVYSRRDGRLWQAGDLMVLPDLANTLERIANQGADEFYTGKTSELLAKYMAESNGLIEKNDLEEYKPVLRVATTTTFRGFDVFGPPPPSSGGITIAMVLNMLEQLDLKTPNGDVAWSEESLHLIAESMRRAFRERAAHLGDSDFVSIPNKLTDPKSRNSFAKQLSESISKSATLSSKIAGEIDVSSGPYESENTTHFSVVDSDGMAVSNTYTLEASWGACVIAPGTGFVLNNEMGDFNWYPGYSNERGAIGTTANQIAPGKRMLSSMSPTIVKRDGNVVLVTGSPGGRTIINTVLCILIQHLAFERSLAESTAAPRFHHQWFPDEIRFEQPAPENQASFEKMLDALKGRGHRIRISAQQGSAHSISVDQKTGVRTGVSDFRRGGRVMVTR